MMPPDLIARWLCLKGSAVGAIGALYWLVDLPHFAGPLLALAVLYLLAAALVERRSQ